MYWLILLICIIAVIVFLIWASADVGSNVYVKTLCKFPENGKVVYLTFDDGPDEIMTPAVLDVLNEYQIKATFFMTGRNIDNNHELTVRVVEEGHTVANHTYSHSFFFPLSGRKNVESEISRCNDVIKSVTGTYPEFFRPPFGVTNPIVGKVLGKSSLKTVGWSIRTYDTDSRRSRESVIKAIMDKLEPGAVILMHDRCPETDSLLKTVIPAILERGYVFRPISKSEM